MGIVRNDVVVVVVVVVVVNSTQIIFWKIKICGSIFWGELVQANRQSLKDREYLGGVLSHFPSTMSSSDKGRRQENGRMLWRKKNCDIPSRSNTC